MPMFWDTLYILCIKTVVDDVVYSILFIKLANSENAVFRGL